MAIGLLLFSVVCFGVRVSLTFHLMCVHVILVRFRLLSGHRLGNGCSFGGPYVLFVYSVFVLVVSC